MKEIAKDTFVVIEYRVRLKDGTYVKGEVEPVSMNFVVGYDQVMHSLERRLLGMKEGEEAEFEIPCEEAFGPYRHELVKFRSYEEFPEGRNLEQGRWVVAKDSRTKASYGYYVKEKRADGVVLDFNHPLAGQSLIYWVKVVKVRPAFRDELEYLRPCEFGGSGSS
ncbi:FKBP-type peptidyl-prolyl cis-trans isomerase [Thermodesulforhabdus norvegica]|nr:FKBP-type peptidyl-prolyl cis-trans isomerase [Thermodesulforhabdus norvegica]